MIAAISVAAPSARLTDQKIPVAGRLVMELAAAISVELGYEKAQTSKPKRAEC
jgi:DNA-binding IclR family transcriptional regulator